jgi:CheY-like chemotaxis protein
MTETTDLLRQTLPASIQISTQLDLPADECRIIGDKNRLQQVLLNLALNAGDAMPNGGQLTIALTAGEAEATDATSTATRPTICLTVSDTGKGIPPEIRDRIFEPFFTTKARGQSTGLGLAIVHAVAIDHGAKISVSSVTGEGTTFRLCFPTDDEAPARASTPGVDQEGVLLVANRDPYQAQLLSSAIGRLGLSTEPVADWRELLDVLERHRDTAVTVLLDAEFANCSARECSEAFAATGAHPRVLVLAERDAPCTREYEDAGFMVLERPLALAEVVRLVAKNQ